MATSEQYFNLVRTSKSSWIAVPVHQTPQSGDGTVYSREPEATILHPISSADRTQRDPILAESIAPLTGALAGTSGAASASQPPRGEPTALASWI